MVAPLQRVADRCAALETRARELSKTIQDPYAAGLADTVEELAKIMRALCEYVS